jgi:DNA-binding transcriptional LysR family regulator
VPLLNLPKDLIVVDVDSDGWDDLVVGGVDLAVLRTVPGVGLAAPVLYEGGDRIAWVAGDVDGDLRPDLVVSGEWPGGVAVLRNRCIP